MSVYDLAHDLARALKESTEYNQYLEVKKQIKEDSACEKMLKELEVLRFKAQQAYFSQKEMEKEDQERLSKLEELVSLNQTVKKYIQAEGQLSVIIQDIQKIIFQSLDLGLEDEQEQEEEF